MREKGNKLGEPWPKVRLSQDRLPIEPFAYFTQMSLPANVASCKCRFLQMSLRANVALCKCCFVQMSLCANVALRKCCFMQMSLCANVTQPNFDLALRSILEYLDKHRDFINALSTCPVKMHLDIEHLN